MLNKQPNSLITLALLLALLGVPKTATASLIAQSNSNSTSSPATETVPENSTINMAGSNSTSGMAQRLIESYQQQNPDANISLEPQATSQTLEKLANGEVDLITIGRPLTPEEKAAGFVAIPFSREKIAILIDKDNPFEGSLTIDQFAKIFRGEITDWSELGGAPGKIKLVDLPDTNDTRQAFPNYEVFRAGEFKTGTGTAKLEQDNIDEAISKLGANGISYAVADDVIQRDDVKVVTMHQTQPDDPRYPFSQPLSFVYQGTPSEAVENFLGFVATSPQAQEIIQSRIGSTPIAASTTVPEGVTTEPNTATAPTEEPDTAIAPEAATEEPDTATAPEAATEEPDTAIAPEDVTEETDAAIAPEEPNTAIAPTEGVTEEPNTEIVPEDATTEPDAAIAPEDATEEPDTATAPTEDATTEPDAAIAPEATTEEPDTATAPTEDVTEEPEQTALVPNTVDGGSAVNDAGNKWTWLWWLPLLGLIPLGALLLGGKPKSDREPAIDNYPHPDGTGGLPVAPTPDGEISSSEVNRAGIGTAEAPNMSNTTVAAAGTALAGGATSASNVFGKTKEQADAIELDNFTEQATNLQTEESTTIQPNVASDFTEQATNLQTEESTTIQPDVANDFTEQATNLQTDTTEDIDDHTSSLLDNISTIGGAAAVGGIAAGAVNLSSDTSDRITADTDNELTEPPQDSLDSTLDNLLDGVSSEQATNLQTEESTTIQPDVANDFTEQVTNLQTDVTEDIDDNTSNLVDNISSIGGAAAVGGIAAGAGNLFSDTSDRMTADTDNELTEPPQDSLDSTLDNLLDSISEQDTKLQTNDLELDEISNLDDLVIDTEVNNSPFANSLDLTSTNIVEDEVTTTEPLNSDTNVTEELQDDTSNGFNNISLEEAVANAVAARDDDPFDDTTNEIEGEIVDFTSDLDTEVGEVTNNFDWNQFNTDNDTSENLVTDGTDTTSGYIDNVADIKIDEITFDDDSEDSVSELLVDIDDTNDNLEELNLDDVTFDDVKQDSVSELLVDVDDTNDNLEELNLDDVTFDDVKQDLVSETLIDDSSEETQNISEWLDNLDISENNSDSISEWLDSLETSDDTSVATDSDRANTIENQSNTELVEQSETEEDALSFQFLEDLLEEDSNSRKDK